MEIFFTLFSKMLALLLLVILGFIARKNLDIDRSSIAKLLFYIIVPLVFFNSTARLKAEPALLILPLISASIASILGYLIFYLSRNFLDSKTRAIFSFASVNSNVGYFLLPIVWEMFDEKSAGIFVIMVLGNVIYENTVGFFIAYQGNYSAKESIIKILKLPAIYAVILGIVFSSVHDIKVNMMLSPARFLSVA